MQNAKPYTALLHWQICNKSNPPDACCAAMVKTLVSTTLTVMPVIIVILITLVTVCTVITVFHFMYIAQFENNCVLCVTSYVVFVILCVIMLYAKKLILLSQRRRASGSGALCKPLGQQLHSQHSHH